MSDITAYIWNPSIYGVVDTFVINAQPGADGSTGEQGPPGFLTEASTGPGLGWLNGQLYVDISTVAGGVDQLYVDATDEKLDASIKELYSTKADESELASYIKSSSTGFGLYWNAGVLDVSVEGSNNDASLNELYQKNSYQDTSIRDLSTTIQAQQVVLVRHESSLGYLQTTKIDATSLAPYATNSSVNTALAKYIKSASTGSGLAWVNGTLYVDVSTVAGGVTIAYVDGSLAKRDSSISDLYNTKISSSALLPYATNASVNNSLTTVNASIGAIKTVNTNQDTSIFNLGVSVASNASAIVSTNASIGLLVTKNSNQDASINAEHAYTDQHWIDINRNGFLNQTETTLAFDASTKVFTLGSVGASWSYYRAGIKYTVAGPKTINLTTVDAVLVDGAKYFIRINSNDGTLSASKIPWTLLDAEIPVAIIAWNNTLNPKFFLQEERHSCLIDRREHYYLHSTRGTQYVSGADVSGYSVLTTTDAANSFSIGQGVIADEDIILTVTAQADGNGTDPSNYVVMTRNGIGNWVWAYSDMPFKYAPSGYIEYDLNGTTTPVNAGNRFVNTYLVLTNTQGIGRHVIVSGQGVYTSTTLAYAETFANFDLSGFPKTEWLGLYQMTWQTGAAGSTQKGKVQLTRAPQRIITSAISASVTTAVVHNSLAGLQGGNVPNNNYYHLDLSTYNQLPYFMTDASVAALGYATNSSVNTALASYIKSASTGAGLYWNAGMLDVSVAGGGTGDVTKAYVDASLASRDASIVRIDASLNDVIAIDGMFQPYEKIDGGNDWTTPITDTVNGGTW